MADREPSPGTVLVPTSLGRVAVHRRGVGPPAVLWHAAWLDSTTWVHVLPALERHRTLFAVDAPGWGESDRLRAPVRLAAIERAAAEVIESVAPGGAVDWLGEGEGARLGLALAAAWPQLVRSVVALAPPATRLRGVARWRLRLLLPAVAVAGPIVVSRPLVTSLLTAEHGADPAAVGTIVDALVQARRGSAARSLAATELGRGDLEPLLARVEAPVLRIDAGGIEDTRALASLEQPRRLAAAVAEFWSRRPADATRARPDREP